MKLILTQIVHLLHLQHGIVVLPHQHMFLHFVKQKLIKPKQFYVKPNQIILDVRQLLVKIFHLLQVKQIVIIVFLDAFIIIINVELQHLQLLMIVLILIKFLFHLIFKVSQLQKNWLIAKNSKFQELFYVHLMLINPHLIQNVWMLQLIAQAIQIYQQQGSWLIVQVKS